MKREILFKAKRVDNGEWIEGYLFQDVRLKFTKSYIIEGGFVPVLTMPSKNFIEVERETVCQFTGLTDKNGVKIFEGNIVLIRKPERSDQTHTGDNIPLGSYTEPLEPMITESKDVVVFKNGGFCLSHNLMVNYYGEDECSPLGWEMIGFTLEEAKEGFCGGWSSYNNKFIWSSENEDEGDLEYLLEEYDLKDENELVKYLGIEVIGSVFDNPELLK